MKIEAKYFDPRCKPLRANPTDAGADLYSTESMILYPQQMHLFGTGVSLKIHAGYVGLVVPRSSQGKSRVSIANTVGVIDADYRGEIFVRLVNEGMEPYEINAFATRIAQIMIMPVALVEFEETDNITNWLDTKRGTGGFGSTGV